MIGASRPEPSCWSRTLNIRTLKITPGLIADIAARAEKDYPKEVCGFLAGKWEGEVGVATHILPAINQHFSDPYHHYTVDLATYRSAEALAVKHGLMLLGVYHSHPDSIPEPSETDSRYAFPEWYYWITPVHKAKAGEPEVFFRAADAKTWINVIKDFV